MSGTDFPNLIDQLGAASMDARQLLGEVRGAMKDMRHLLAESAAERKRLGEAVKAAVDKDVGELITAELDKLAERTKEAIREGEDRIHKRFDRIGDILLTGDAQGDGPNLIAAAAKIASQRGAPAPGRRCPYCKGLIEDETNLDGTGPPKDGDVSICERCGKVAFYTDNAVRLRRLSAAEELEMKDNASVRAAVETVRRRKASRR